jgi:hypothetical protein
MRTTARSCLALLAAVVGCDGGDTAPPAEAPGAAGVAASSTPEQRAALFDTILARTMRREAFSPVKNQRLGLDVEAAMRAVRPELVAADDDPSLYHALVKLSAARRDRHLSVQLVEGGLDPGFKDGLRVAGGLPATPDPLHAPVRFAPDYGNPNEPFFFLVDWAEDASVTDAGVAVGDRLIGVNGRSAEAWYQAAAPYMRHSTDEGSRWKLAQLLPQRSAVLPMTMYEETLVVELERTGGERYMLDLPYRPAADLVWGDRGEPRYRGFTEVFQTPTYTLFQSDDRPVLLLSWVGFREHMVEDVDRLMAWAAEEGRLDHDVIFDATRSGGGSRGAYAVRRLSPHPFKTTFGNLRLSDAGVAFVEQAKEEAGRLLDSGVQEADDNGRWLLDWLETDVAEAIADGRDYTNDVPFKLAHAPKDSDGVLQPAPVHFTGQLVVLLGPDGGSHLDQFAAIVADNDLGSIVGMPGGGYSNTWEWEELLTMPGTDLPVAEFMWSIGHTIRPNGELAEGNPAPVDVWIPLTRANAAEYYATLLGEALELLGQQ